MSVVFQCISSHTYYLMMVMHTQIFIIGFVTKIPLHTLQRSLCQNWSQLLPCTKNTFKISTNSFTKSHVTLQNLSAKVGVSCYDVPTKKTASNLNKLFYKSHVSFGYWGWSSWTGRQQSSFTISSWWTQDDMIFFKTSKQQLQTCKKQILVRNLKVIVIAWTIKFGVWSTW